MIYLIFLNFIQYYDFYTITYIVGKLFSTYHLPWELQRSKRHPLLAWIQEPHREALHLQTVHTVASNARLPCGSNERLMQRQRHGSQPPLTFLPWGEETITHQE